MIFEVGMDKNTKKSKRRKKQNIQDFEIEQDENFDLLSAILQVVFLMGILGKNRTISTMTKKTYLSKVRCNL